MNEYNDYNNDDKNDDGMRDWIKKLDKEDEDGAKGPGLIVFLSIVFLATPWVGGLLAVFGGFFASMALVSYLRSKNPKRGGP